MKPSLGQIGVFVTWIALLTWPTRLLIQLYLEEKRLKNDAAYRVTVTMAYLSFLSRGKGLETKEEKLLVLASLFSPMPTDKKGEPANVGPPRS